jgi:hypothetical protein
LVATEFQNADCRYLAESTIPLMCRHGHAEHVKEGSLAFFGGLNGLGQGGEQAPLSC